MTLRFSCTQCGRHLKADDRFAGRQARCTQCGASLIVPLPAADDAEKADSEDTALPVTPVELHSPENLVDMTAMVDIVFFLLIFFLVTSMQGVCASIGLPAPDPQKVATKGQRTIADFESDAEYLIVRIDQEDVVWIEDQEIPSQQELLGKLREKLDSPKAPRRMLVLGSGDARHATVVRVLDAGNEVGLEDVRLALDEEP